VHSIEPGAAADGNTRVTVTWRGQQLGAAYNADYTPVVGHTVLLLVQPPQIMIYGRLTGTPPTEPPEPAAATIAFRAAAVTTLNSSASSIAVALPAGVEPGDALVIWLYASATGSQVTGIPAGWRRLLGRGSRPLGSFAFTDAYWRIADGTEAATHTVTFASAANNAVAVAQAYSGTSPTTPFGRVRLTNPAGAPTSFTTHPLGGSVADAWILTAAATRKSGGSVSWTTNDDADIERVEAITATGGIESTLAAYDSARAQPLGETTTRTLTASGIATGSSVAGWSAELISNQVTGAGPIAFRGASNARSLGTTSPATATVTAPAGVADGDLLLAFVSHVSNHSSDPDTGNPAVPAGWAKIGHIQLSQLAGNTHQTEVYYKIASAEPASYNFTVTGSGTVSIAATVAAYSGINQSSPIGSWAGQNYSSGSPTYSTGSLLTTTDGGWVVSALLSRMNAGVATSDPADVERSDVPTDTESIALYDSARTFPAGTSISRVFTAASTNTVVTWLVEIKPGVLP
jgi:hypothetical protein